jgi:hypothetical protein
MTKFAVTQRHIDQGVRKNMSLCPVAMCLLEQGFGIAVRVGDNEIFYREAYGVEPIDTRPHDKIVETPASVKTFVRAFDRGEKVFPFEFELGQS